MVKILDDEDNEDYLREILNDQNLSQDQYKSLKDLRKSIRKRIENNFDEIPIVYYGGSYRKKTIIRENYDLDIVMYWPPNTSYEVGDLYRDVGSVLQSYWKELASRKVGWEIKFPGNFHIDVIPGIRDEDDRRYAYLYNRDFKNNGE